MLKKINTEMKLGAIFGMLAIIAIVFEMALGNFTPGAIASGLKDISGTMVSVMVFVIAVKSIMQKKEKYTFDEKITMALDEWQKSNLPIISKKEITKEGKLRYFMLTDPKNFFYALPKEEIEKRNSGWFVQMPPLFEDSYKKENVTLQFHLNKGTFFEGLSDEQVDYEKLVNLFVPLMLSKFGNIIKASGKNQEITIVFSNMIETDDDIKQLVAVLDKMVQLYMIAANIRW